MRKNSKTYEKNSTCSRPEVLCKKGVLKNFEKFAGKNLCWSLSLTVTGLKCFHVNFAKFLRTPNLNTFSNGCVWKSCPFGSNCTITDPICWNNFLTYHGLILLYYLRQKILKQKTSLIRLVFFTHETRSLHITLVFYLPVILWITSI